MRQRLIILFILLITVSCGIQSQLKRSYQGRNIEYLTESFKTLPSVKTPLKNGLYRLTFTKKARLTSTPINQGTGSLDPLSSPAALKTEYYIFIINRDDIVISTEYEKEYKKL